MHWFFVNPTTVITAAHCFYSFKDGKLLELRSIETKDGELMDAGVVILIPHPRYYKEAWSPNDIGIIKTPPNNYFRGSFALAESLRAARKISLFPWRHECGTERFRRALIVGWQGDRNSFKRDGQDC